MDPAGVWCFFSTGTDAVRGCQDSVDVVGISWRWEAALPASLIVQEAEFRECSEGKLETKARHTVYTKRGMRGRRLEGLLFASCKFIPIMCLQLRPVCTVCLQSGAINVIVRGCSWQRRLSYFSLPGSKWPLAALLLHCFSFSNVNASLDLYRPLYTLLFFIFLPVPGWSTNMKRLSFTMRRQLRCVSAMVTEGRGVLEGLLKDVWNCWRHKHEVDFPSEWGRIQWQSFILPFALKRFSLI